MLEIGTEWLDPGGKLIVTDGAVPNFPLSFCWRVQVQLW